MNTVVVGHEFFRKERNSAYANWKSGFWREMEQNSDDAGSTRVEVSLSDYGNGCIIEFSDNGCGMTEDVIRNVFMRLGETTKSGGMTGGFGRARMLTHFSMSHYQIETGNLLIEGSGAEYEISTRNQNVKGTRQTIWIEDANKNDMLHALHGFLSHCQLNHEFRINGELWTSWLHRRKKVRDLSFGSVHTNKSNKKNIVIFRVNGVEMFSRYTSANAQVIVEINPNESRKVLTSNRDGIHTDYQRELDEFLSELAVDTVTALKPKRKDKGVRRYGRGNFISRSNREKLAEVMAEAKAVLNGVATDQQRQKVAAAVAAVYGDTKDIMSAVDDILTEDPSDRIDMHDVVIADECYETVAVRRVIDSYDPISWKETYWNGRWYKKGGNKLKLLTIWQVAVRHALEILQEEMPGSDIPWNIGWIFSDEEDKNKTFAMHRSDENGIHEFLLNPVNNDGKMRWRLTGNDDRAKIFALALHEAAHVYCGFHDQEFSYLHTALTMRGMARQREVIRDMKDALESLPE